VSESRSGEDIRCLVRAETISGRTYVLIVFPDDGLAEGQVNCWSPLEGHTRCEKEYVLSHTQSAEDSWAETMMNRYALQHLVPVPGALPDRRLVRLKAWPKDGPAA
jgi:hypothetical protein